ncbi:hypothetical protein ACFYMO_11880 [Streptomyces sp. NPDC007025]|uniref:hypothetical protein n=1 Tax=Streptomyces sp. NPDC007025 TaxID=3364771 RepID=UPI00369DE40C
MLTCAFLALPAPVAAAGEPAVPGGDRTAPGAVTAPAAPPSGGTPSGPAPGAAATGGAPGAAASGAAPSLLPPAAPPRTWAPRPQAPRMPRLPDLPKLPRFPQAPEPPRLPGAESPSPLPGAPGQPPVLPEAAPRFSDSPDSPDSPAFPAFAGHPNARTPADRRGHPVRWNNGEAERHDEGNSRDGTRHVEEDGQGAQDERGARQHGREQRQPRPRDEQLSGERAEKQKKRPAKRDRRRRDAAGQRTAHRERDPRERGREQPPAHGEGDRRQQRQQEHRINPPNHRAALRPPASFGNATAPRPSGQAIGKHDLYAADDAGLRSDEGRGGRLAAQPSGQVLPVLPLGTGLTLMGLGLAFLALRVRRGG